MLLRASFEGEWRERGAHEGRAYSQRLQLEVSSQDAAAAPPRSRCFGSAGAQATAAVSVSSINWDALVRANAGQGWRMDSSGCVSRLLKRHLRAGGSRRCEAEGRRRAAREGASHGGSGAGGAGSVRNMRRGDQAVGAGVASRRPAEGQGRGRGRKAEDRLGYSSGLMSIAKLGPTNSGGLQL